MSINRYNFDEDPELFNSQSFLMLKDSPFLSYPKFRRKTSASNFEENRTKWLKEALHDHILKGYPYSNYTSYDSLEDYYDFLAGCVDPDASPQELIQEVISSLINHLDFDNYPRDPTYGYLKVNSIVLCNIQVLSKLLYIANDEIKEYFFVKSLQFILRLFKDPRPTATLYGRSFEYQVIECLNSAVREGSMVIYFNCLSEKSILKKQLDEYGCLEEINRTILKSVLSSANFYYPGRNSCYGSTIDTERAFKVYSAIPKWATVEFGEAQFWMAKLICYHSNFTPENFDKETITNKKLRLLAMKPHLEAAAENGNDLAIGEKIVLDEELDKILVKSNKRRILAIDESNSNKILSTESLSIYCFFIEAPVQANTGIDESISHKKLRY